jgi:hypothetical protein
MSDDTAAIAAYAAAVGLTGAATIAAQWATRDDDDKTAFRAIAAAAIEAATLKQPAELAAAMAETRMYRQVILDVHTALLEGGQDHATARKRAMLIIERGAAKGLTIGGLT